MLYYYRIYFLSMEQTIQVGHVYRHFKGNTYKIIAIARDSETTDEVVVYQGLQDSSSFGSSPLWVRSKKEFLSCVIIDGKEQARFAPVNETEPLQ